eukprot:15353511-Ditylum_brightwellii.AAC.1
MQYFSGMLTKDFSLTYCILEVGERTTKLKWRVTNHHFLGLNCSNLKAEEQMAKKGIFVFLVMSFPNIPPLVLPMETEDGRQESVTGSEDISEARIKPHSSS